MMSNKNNKVNMEAELFQMDDQKKQEILEVLKKEVRKKSHTEKRKSFMFPTFGIVASLLLLFLLFNDPLLSFLGNVGFNGPNADKMLDANEGSKQVVEDFFDNQHIAIQSKEERLDLTEKQITYSGTLHLLVTEDLFNLLNQGHYKFRVLLVGEKTIASKEAYTIKAIISQGKDYSGALPYKIMLKPKYINGLTEAKLKLQLLGDQEGSIGEIEVKNVDIEQLYKNESNKK